MATQKLSFQKIATVPASGLVVGRIYFETSTNTIKVANSATAVDTFGKGVKHVEYNQATKVLNFIDENGTNISLDLSDVASASSIATELAKKLNIGASSDASTVQSYHGLKKYTDEAKASAVSTAKTYTDTQINAIPAPITYKADGTTVTQSGTSTVTFAVGTIPQSKVTNLATDLAAKATTTALNAVKTTADAAAPQATTYTKTEVDNKVAAAVGSVYKMKGSLANVAALTALTGVVIGDTYNILAAGTLNGEAFEAGSNFVATKAGAGNQTGMWDKLGGTIDLSAYAKSADVSNTYATKASVTSAINALDVADTAVAGQVVSQVSETDGKIAVVRRALVADDIPSLATSKISGLDTALAGKVPTTRNINHLPLTSDIFIQGSDIIVGGNGNYSDYDIATAINTIDDAVKEAAKGGVQSFGTKTGAITLKAVASTNGAVNLVMSNNELQGSVYGLKSAAYTESSAYDAAGAATTALNSAKSYADSLMVWSEWE